MAGDLWQLSATQVVALLRGGQVTPLQLIEACEQRWKATDGALNAMPITCWQRAKQRAYEMMATGSAQQAPAGYLWGLPVAIKDLTSVKGLPFTQGSLLFKDRIAADNDPLVDLLEARGAIIVGKTNTPELGAGSQTYNEVYGTTRNPWDPSKTAGGSSGGSAAALAVGQVWLATGTDLGGSLRNPASYCGVVGLRPTSGLIPERHQPPSPLQHPAAARLKSVSGPLAINVTDLALLLDAMSATPRADSLTEPLPPPEALLVGGSAGCADSSDAAAGTSCSCAAAGGGGGAAASTSYAAAVQRPPSGLRRVAVSPDLGGVSPVDAQVAHICRAAAAWFRGLGAEVVDGACPDFVGCAAPRVFHALRALHFRQHSALAEEPLRSRVKPELVWQVEQGRALTDEQVAWAEQQHDALLASAAAFWRDHDLLVCPAAMLPPFDASIIWPREFEGHEFGSYIDWMMVACVVSLLDAPAISIPAGLTAQGLPVGVQLVAAPGQERLLLAAAAAFERAHPFSGMVPLRHVGGGSAGPAEA